MLLNDFSSEILNNHHLNQNQAGFLEEEKNLSFLERQTNSVLNQCLCFENKSENIKLVL